MKEGKDIDKLFKDGLENPDLPFNDLDWDDLEERLHPKPKSRIVPLVWLSAAAGIAAMLFIVFLLIKPAGLKTGVKDIVKTDKADKINTPLNNGIGNLKPVPAPETGGEIHPNSLAVNPGGIMANQKAQKNEQELNIEAQQKTIEIGLSNTNSLANVVYKPQLPAEINPVAFKDQPLTASIALGKPERVKAPVIKQKSRFVLSILAAPDLTSVQKSGKSSLSGGFGLEATVSLTKRLSITTGAAYAKKIYDSDFNLYKPNSSYVFKVQPTNVHANCDVIDIPLNVNYKIFDNKRNAISVSTGLSSYLMLKENYSYNYAGDYQGPQSFEVRNQNQHYLGIANVGVEFQHKINNNLSISAKPFMKIPLTDIGYGNSKLSSTGVAVSLNMNLFKKD